MDPNIQKAKGTTTASVTRGIQQSNYCSPRFRICSPRKIATRGVRSTTRVLCAGITTFGPLNRHILQKGGGKGKKVGIVEFGGLGHMAAKLAKAMGCEVTLLSRDESKKAKANELGAGILAHTDADAMKAAAKSFNLIIDTVSAPHDIAEILGTVKPKGTYCCLGAIPKPFEVSAFALIRGNLSIEGSLVGGIPETQAMMNFCAAHQVLPEYKVIAAKDAAAQFKAMANGTAGAGRAVIDMDTLNDMMLKRKLTLQPNQEQLEELRQ